MMWDLARATEELKKFDHMLRIRQSEVRGDTWKIERKVARESRCRLTPSDFMNRDAFIAARDGYIPVVSVPKHSLDQRVLSTLRNMDMWSYGGAGRFADMLEEQEALLEAQEERRQDTLRQEMWDETYDRLRLKARDGGAGSDLYVSDRVFNVFEGEKVELSAD